MTNLKGNTLLKQHFMLLLVLLSVTSCFAADIELKIGRNELLNPEAKNDLWLHIISHEKDSIRSLTFRNGSATAIYLVSSVGISVHRPRFSSPKRYQGNYNQRPFTISPGDTSGTIVGLKSFKMAKSGLHYMIFAIPDPEGNGIIVSKPCELFIQNGEFESVNSIDFSDLPNSVRNTFRFEFERFLNQEGCPPSSFRLPF